MLPTACLCASNFSSVLCGRVVVRMRLIGIYFHMWDVRKGKGKKKQGKKELRKNRITERL